MTLTPTPLTAVPKYYLRFRPLLVVWTKDAREAADVSAARSTLVKDGGGLADIVDVRVVYRTATDQQHALDDIASRAVTEHPEAISLVVGDLLWADEASAWLLEKPMDSALETANADGARFVESSARLKTVITLPCVPVVEFKKSAGPPGLWTLPLLPSDSQEAVKAIEKTMETSIASLYRARPVYGDNKLITSSVGLSDESHRKATRETLRALGAAAQLDLPSEELDALQRLVFPISPGARSMRIVKLYTDGKSGAVVAALDIDGEADVIIKVGSPLALQSELYGYSTVMDRKLRTGVGSNALYGQGRNGMTISPVGTPEGKVPQRSLALLAYSYAGPPGDHAPPRSLHEVLEEAVTRADLRPAALTKLSRTVETTVAALHDGASARSRTLWQSFGQVLPPLLAVRVTPSEAVGAPKDPNIEFKEGPDKALLTHDAAAFRAAAAATEKGAKENATEESLGPRLLYLKRMSLHDVTASLSEGVPGAQIRHPRLGMRVTVDCPLTYRSGKITTAASEITTAASDFQGKPWLRRGCRFDVAGEAVDLGASLSRQDLLALLDIEEREAKTVWSARQMFLPLLHYKVGADNDPKPFPGEAMRYIDVTFPTAVGATHGDLNTKNVLFTGEDKTGWLIDFEHARNDGAIAFDYAKLIVEIVNHLLLRQLKHVCTIVSGDAEEVPDAVNRAFTANYQFLLTTLAESLSTPLAAGALATLVATKRPLATLKGEDPALLLPFIADYVDNTPLAGLAFTLEALSEVTRAALASLRKAHKVHKAHPDNAQAAAMDLQRAVGTYAFASKKFFKGPAETHRRRALEFFATCCLRLGIPGIAASRADVAATQAAAGAFAASTATPPTGASPLPFLLHWLHPAEKVAAPAADVTVAPAPTPIAEMTAPLKQPMSSETAERFNELVTGFFEAAPVPFFPADDLSKPQYWDFASTGSICNLSPFLGYLWLMTRSDSSKNQAPRIYVPKVASKGAGGGTIDTLSAAGYTFYSDRGIVQSLVHQDGGYFFQQSDDLTGYDEPLMDMRKPLNLMASGELVLASILAKKLAIGTTHVVIDIKLGADTKMYRRLGRVPMPDGMKAEDIAGEARFVPIPEVGQAPPVFVKASKVPKLAAWLAALLGGGFDNKAEFVVVEWQAPWGRKVQVRLVFSNADTPQCRAVGRLLALHQLIQINDASGTLPQGIADWYLQHIPKTLDAPAACVGVPAAAWQTLKVRLPALDTSEEFKFIQGVLDKPARQPSVRSGCGSLAALTVWPNDVPKWKDAKLVGCTITAMYAYPLDTPLFEGLQRHTNDDAGIGFWLHQLPGERLDAEKAVITAFYRPTEDEGALLRSLIRYLSEHVSFC